MNKYEIMNQERQLIDSRKKVAAYCRVSTDSDDQANSFESQQKFFRRYIEDNTEWTLYEVFADEGITGTSTKKRREFNRMIECAKNGVFDLIITKEISRFARNTLDSIYYTRELKKYGVGVIFLNDNINTLNDEGELHLSLMASLAQEESRRTSQRVKWGQKQRMADGVVFGRSMLGYDVENGKLTINAEGAKIVRLIFHKFVDEGKGCATIASELREEGIRPMRAKEWNNTAILRALRNEKYCGDLVQQKTFTPDYLSHEKKYNKGEEEFIIIKDHHEPIVSREIFEAANKILDARTLSPEAKAKHSNRYPFSGKIICGKCGSAYSARYKKKNGVVVYKAWNCTEAHKNGRPRIDPAGNHIGCSNNAINNEDAIAIMNSVCRQFDIDRVRITNNLISAIDKVLSLDMQKADVDSIYERIEDIKKKRTGLIELFTSGDIERDEFKVLREKYETELDRFYDIIESVDKQQEMVEKHNEIIAEIRKNIEEIINGMAYEDEYYAHMLDHMVVHDREHIDVYLKMLPGKWTYAIAKAGKLCENMENPAENGDMTNENADVPISVSKPFNSAYGMA